MPQNVPTQAEFQALADRVTALEATAADHESRIAALEGSPPPPAAPTADLTGPDTIEVNADYTLHVATSNATSATLDGVSCTLNGDVTLTAPATAGDVTHTLVATGAGGSAQDSLTITVNEPAPPPPDTGTYPTYATIVTAYDTIPNFALSATILSVQSGSWSDPAIWNLGRVPDASDVVGIKTGHVITLAGTESVVAVGVAGKLAFTTGASLTAQNILVYDSGELEIGTPLNPIAAEVVFADAPLVDAAGGQYSNGLIVLGKFSVEGAAKTPFVRLAADVAAGATSLSYQITPVGWQAGDIILLPDSKQGGEAHPGFRPWDERVSLTASGITAAQFEHKGWRDEGGILDPEWMPHAVNLTRGVVFRSANPVGVRGHVFVTTTAQVTVRNAEFRDTGRTTFQPLNPSTNHIGRYGFHCHHLTNPFTVEGCVIRNTDAYPSERKWGFTIHDSDNGLFRGNVIYNYGGAGLMTEDGGETGNVIEGNFVGLCWGAGGSGNERDASGDFGFEGTSFWFRGPANVVRNNVAYGGRVYGYAIFCYQVQAAIETPINVFDANEAYCTGTSLTLWNIGAGFTGCIPGMPQSVVRDFKSWHGSPYYGYPTFNVLFVNFRAAADFSRLANGQGAHGMYFGDYLTADNVFDGGWLKGFDWGFLCPSFTRSVASAAGGSLFTVSNMTIKCEKNVLNEPPYAVTGGGTNIGPRRVEFTTCTLQKPQQVGGTFNHVKADWRTDRPSLNLTVLDELIVNGRQCYYYQQAGSFVIPNSSGVYPPGAQGLTNDQAWAQLGAALAGAVLPASAVDLPDYNCKVV